MDKQVRLEVRKMTEIKKETSAVTEVPKKCLQGCDFTPVDATDRFCGKCGTKLV